MREREHQLITVMVHHEKGTFLRGMGFYLTTSRVINPWRVPIIIGIILVSLVFTWMMGELSLLNLSVIVFSCMALLVDGVRYLWIPRKLYRELEGNEKERTYRFSNEDITIQNQEEAGIYDWNLAQLWRGGGYYFLILTDGSYHMIPIGGFQSKEEEKSFIQMARDNSPTLKMKGIT